MPKPPAAPPVSEAEPAEQSAERMAMTICQHVVTALGRPDDCLRVTARQITRDGYRVNVVTGSDLASARIAHSFFITADQEGKIICSAPAIRKQY